MPFSAHTLLLFPLLFLLSQTVSAMTPSSDSRPLRPPAVPLIACDPYFSVWSPADRLTDAETMHWTGHPHPLHSLIRVDGQTFRLMGAEPQDLPALPQTRHEVLPTHTVYHFTNDAIEVTLTFMTPALPDDLDRLSRPVTYLTWEVKSRDGKSHDVSLYYDNTADLVVNTPDQPVVWGRETVGGLAALKMGSKEQPILAKKGDNLRIDWGYLYAASLAKDKAHSTVADRNAAVQAFVQGQPLPTVATADNAPAAENAPVMAVAWDLGSVGSKAVSRTLLLAYDDLYSIEYFHQRLRPYWRRNGDTADDLLRKSAEEFPELEKKTRALDETMTAALKKEGGEQYARIATLAYREALAGNKLVADSKGGPLFFPKENFSNGCIATVDVIYPMAPQFLFISPALMKASLVPVLDYAASPRWKWPFAPHDLGTYPKANGQVYGGGERTEENQMPVEESGNLLILLAAVAKADGNAHFARSYWPVLQKWAEYLKSKGLDPENQLCTDDFAGHLAHNVNLSAKAIMGLRAYAMLCEMEGKREEAAAYRKLTEDYVERWQQMADDGDHTRLAFDKPGTWSQKYNLVWDRILGFHLFPESVFQKEIAYYLKVKNEYGLPLDNRRDYTKLDWTVWTATMGNEKEFREIVEPVYRFLNASPDRVPMTDWYGTKDAKVVGFRARPVVGGVFIKMLQDGGVWKHWADRGTNVSTGTWATQPEPPVVREVVPTSQRQPSSWRYTTETQDEGWFQPDFDAAGWPEGPGGFGTEGTPGAVVRTKWDTPDLWIRRSFTLQEGIDASTLQLLIHHDEDAEAYLNGVLAASLRGFVGEYDLSPLTEAAKASLLPGVNTLAIHCHQTTGGQYIDAGLVEVTFKHH